MLVHKASDLVGTRRFVRIAAKPVVNVMVKAHSASAIVIVEHVAERISAGCRNRGKIRSLVQRADQEADGRGRAAWKFLLPPPECACWRSPVNRDSKQSARTDERSHVLKRAPHLAGVVEDTPAVNNVIGLRGQPEQVRGFYGPVLSDIKLRKKAACGFYAVGVNVDPIDLASTQSQSGGHGQARATAHIQNSRSAEFSIRKQLDQSSLGLGDAFFVRDGGKGLPIFAKCKTIDCRHRAHVRVPVEEGYGVCINLDWGRGFKIMYRCSTTAPAIWTASRSNLIVRSHSSIGATRPPRRNMNASVSTKPMSTPAERAILRSFAFVG